MGYCLPKQLADKFIQSLKDGSIDPGKLSQMSSAERNDFFSKIVGEDDAKEVNSQFESKLLLKNQQQGMINWAKKLVGITEAARTDLLSKIERMDKVLSAADQKSFLGDLASKKLGTEVTFDEAKQITQLSKDVTEKQKAVDPTSSIRSQSRMEYGASRVALQEFINELKLSNNKTTISSIINDFKTHPLASLKKYTLDIAGFSKAFNAAFDNSFWGRQGFKAIATHPVEWATDFAKSWKDIAQQFTAKGNWYGSGDNAVMEGIKSDIYSRPNALNGRYQLGKFDLLGNEEAYPTSLPEYIPLIGRMFKASEVAYTGGALRLRADIADSILQKAQEAGIDLTDKTEIQSIGKMVNALTGRGYLGKGEIIAKPLNVALFSPRSLKSNFDFLTAHQLQKDVTPFVRQQATMNLLKTSALIGTVLLTAKAINPKSVDFDPRSSNFGKIKIGNTTIDVTGGTGSLATLLSRVLTQSSKSTATGKVTPLNSNKYGAKTVKDVFVDYFTNKLSPVGQVANETLLTGKTFQGKKPTFGGEASNLFTPLPVKNIQEVLSTPGGANAFMTGLIDAVGFVTNTYNSKKK